MTDLESLGLRYESPEKRGCGFRKPYGLYLVGMGLTIACDRLSLAFCDCAVCGNLPRFNRGVSKINPLTLFGTHKSDRCKCLEGCYVCNPPDIGIETDIPFMKGDVVERIKGTPQAYLMWVGRKYYTERGFIEEAHLLGVSKRISRLPKGFDYRKSFIYLAIQHCVEETKGFDPKKQKNVKKDGVFYAFRPKQVEYLIYDDEVTEELVKEFRAKGIEPVLIKRDYGKEILGKETKLNKKKRQEQKAKKEGLQRLKMFYPSDSESESDK